MKLNSINQALCVALSGIEMPKKVEFFQRNWPSLDEQELFAEAELNEVVSHVAFVLQHATIPTKCGWSKALQIVEESSTVLMEVLEEVATECRRRNIKLVALKNAGILCGIYSEPGCSPMGDIDVLVKKEDFLSAHEVLMSLGFKFEFRSELEEASIDAALRSGGTEYWRMHGQKRIWFELQWRPIAGRWIQPHNEPDGDLLVDRAVPIDNSSVFLLRPEDNLLQVALHTAKHSYVRAPGFRLHSDVDRIVRNQTIDWSMFTERVGDLSVRTGVYFSLYFASELLGTPIPNDVMKSLRPGPVKRRLILWILESAGIFHPHEKKFSRIGYIIFVCLLYDNLGQLGRAIFPKPRTIKERTNGKSGWQLPGAYVRRIFGLVTKRDRL